MILTERDFLKMMNDGDIADLLEEIEFRIQGQYAFERSALHRISDLFRQQYVKSLPEPTYEERKEWVSGNSRQFIDAIGAYSKRTNMGLRDSKALADMVRNGRA